MPSYKLIYFNVRGRAEMTRLVFAAAGVKYEDCRLDGDDGLGEEFQTLKASGAFPFGQLPVLEVDGKVLSQSMPIMKFVARETGFSPSDSWETAKADMIVDGIADLTAKIIKASREKDEELKKTLLKTFYEKDIPAEMAKFEKLLNASGGKHFSDNKLTYADILFFGSVEAYFHDMVKEGVPPALNDFPSLKDLYERVSNNPGIKEWVKNRPDSPF